MSENTRKYARHGLSADPEWRRNYNAAYYRAHRERLLAAADARYQTRKDAYAAKYQENRETILARSRERWRQDGERLRARQRERYQRDKANAIRRALKRQAQKRLAGIGSDRVAYLAAVNHIRTAPEMACHWCSEPLERMARVIDHIIPLCRGGKDAADNICCACQPCNANKGTKLPSEWQRSELA